MPSASFSMLDGLDEFLLKKFLHSEVNRIICVQHVVSLSRCRVSRPKLPLQTSSYPNLSLYWVGADSIYWVKIPSPSGIELTPQAVVQVQSSILKNQVHVVLATFIEI